MTKHSNLLAFGLAVGLAASVFGIVRTVSPPGHHGSGETVAAMSASVTSEAASSAAVAGYLQAKWDPIHFKPAIDKATDKECLACHKEILSHKVREQSPAGVAASDALAWYETLDTYEGDQQTFHARHLTTPFAKAVMSLKCNFCHQGNDPREEAAGSSATTTRADLGSFTLRKMVDPSQTCLRCHGKYPQEVMTGVEGPWTEARAVFEDAENPDMQNGCLACHQMGGGFRTVRHQVSYLKADEIEKLAKQGSSDVCYGCHGGRAWYRISYPYPRHPWPDMSDEMPDWAKDRPTTSDPRFALDQKTNP